MLSTYSAGQWGIEMMCADALLAVRSAMKGSAYMIDTTRVVTDVIIYVAGM